jgi:SAM-dependent methyltransferase
MAVKRAAGGRGSRFKRVHATIADYYARKLAKHGPTPLGVDWSCVATQELRFAQLLKICRRETRFSLNDVGCGYGAVLAYIARRHPEAEVDYLGFDLAPSMIAQAVRIHGRQEGRNFIVADASPRVADYSIASGIFNVKLDQPLELWEQFVAGTMHDMRTASRKGFAVNFMKAAGTRGEPAASLLYRTTPRQWTRFCETELGSGTEIVADYGLREFTLLVRG